jgi:hypothetical protein
VSCAIRVDTGSRRVGASAPQRGPYAVGVSIPEPPDIGPGPPESTGGDPPALNVHESESARQASPKASGSADVGRSPSASGDSPRGPGGRTPGQRKLEPPDLPMVPFALAGMGVWAVVGLIFLAIRPTLAAHGHENWIWICVAGFLLGVPGLALMLVRDARRRRRRADAGN